MEIVMEEITENPMAKYAKNLDSYKFVAGET